MVSENIASLLDVIEKEQVCCSRLIEVSKGEQQSLVDNDLGGLSRRILEMQDAVRDLHQLQAERKTLLDSFAKELDVGADKFSLYALFERLGGEAAERLKSRFRDLLRTGEALYQVNQQTIYLINFSLDLIERQIGAWTGALTGEQDGYGRDGKTTAVPADAKIIRRKA